MAAIDLLIAFLVAVIKLLILSELAWALGFLALGFFVCGCRRFVSRLNSCALGVLWAHAFFLIINAWFFLVVLPAWGFR